MGYVIRAFSMEPFDRHIGKMRIADLKRGDLKVISRLVEEERLKPCIDRSFQLKETPQAVDYLDGGHVQGKIVITMPER
jgi:NADPH:quinone reductase-like Zn-dependent oxidoreductase